MKLKQPYLLFLGDAPDAFAAKTAIGIAHWRPQMCVGQLSLPGCQASVGLQEMDLEAAWNVGARTLVLGVANRGGVFNEKWADVLKKAVEIGFDIASGLHTPLSGVQGLARFAADKGVMLHDVRRFGGDLPVGTGRPRSGKRLLTVGTDCSVGKMYTSLALEREMRNQGLDADFRATGQTGIFIAGEGISVDAVIADFIAGAAEVISPANADDHWDIVEGQGSLFHPSYAGVSMGLLHGSQPDLLVLCHDPKREHMRGIPHLSVPSLQETINANIAAARLTNNAAKCIGIAVNTKAMAEDEALAYLERTSRDTGLPCVDPVRTGVAQLVKAIVSDS